MFLRPQKLSYEERMARRLLGPQGPISMFDQGDAFEPHPVQVRIDCTGSAPTIAIKKMTGTVVL